MTLPPGQRLDLYLQMDALRAEEVLREHGGSLRPQAVRDLTRIATGSEEAAEDAFVRAIEADLRRGGSGL